VKKGGEYQPGQVNMNRPYLLSANVLTRKTD